MRFVTPALAALVLGLVLAAASPGARTGATSCGEPTPTPQADTPPLGGDRVSGLAQAAARLPFAPLVPAGRPYRVYVSEKPALLGVTYVLASGRWFHLVESRTGYLHARASFDTAVRGSDGREGECGGHFKAVRLRNGDLALLSQHSDRVSLNMLSGSIYVRLASSAKGANRSQLVRVANALNAARA